jgi:excisionase family DNA binding protein
MPGERRLCSDRDATANADGVAAPGTTNPGSVASRHLLLSVPEAARALGIARSSLYLLMDRHELTSVSIGRRRLLPARALEEYVDRLIERSQC